ncbi:MAG: hypothetical protein WCK82_03335 [Bacteroidota bacterium]|jgi:hypothetical protein
MTNQEKAMVYDQLIRESDKIQRENSKLKSEYTANIPSNIQRVIDENNSRIAVLVGRLESLFK